MNSTKTHPVQLILRFRTEDAKRWFIHAMNYSHDMPGIVLLRDCAETNPADSPRIVYLELSKESENW